jgi:threonine dehydrogenase-like Zn-dependent dehydrogenase
MILSGAGDICIENIPGATLVEPADALIRVSRTVSTKQAINTAIEIARPESAVGRVGVLHSAAVPLELTAIIRTRR